MGELRARRDEGLIEGLIEVLTYNMKVLIASLIVLSMTSYWVISYSVKLADITGFGRTNIGFVLVAFSTSLPELSVSVFSAIGRETIGMAIGNALGSNVVNVCLVLGVCILFASAKRPRSLDFMRLIAGEELRNLQFGLFVASMIPLILLYIGHASRLVGVVLVALFAYNTYQISKRRQVREEGTPGGERKRLLRYSALTIIGSIGVIASSYFVVESASDIAVTIGVPRVIIGATVIAFGTSLPELATSLEATRSGNIGLALGNVVGSGFLNTTLVLGIPLVASELIVNMGAFADVALFSLIANMFLWYFLSGSRIGKREGTVLIFLYAVFLAVIFGVYRR